MGPIQKRRVPEFKFCGPEKALLHAKTYLTKSKIVEKTQRARRGRHKITDVEKNRDLGEHGRPGPIAVELKKLQTDPRIKQVLLELAGPFLVVVQKFVS